MFYTLNKLIDKVELPLPGEKVPWNVSKIKPVHEIVARKQAPIWSKMKKKIGRGRLGSY